MTSGTRAQILGAISDSSQWSGDNNIIPSGTFTAITSFTISDAPTSCNAPTPTPTNTPTNTPTDEPTPTPTNTPTDEPTPTPTNTPIPATATPTSTPRPLPQVVITELMYDAPGNDDGPSADDDFEWFEIYNYGATDAVLDGCIVAESDDTPFFVISSLLVPAGSYAVLGQGGVSPAPDYLYPDSWDMTNTADSLKISCDGQLVDQVVYDEGAGWPAISSSTGDPLESLQFDGLQPLDASSPTANDSSSNWCVRPDMATPGQANSSCSAGPDTLFISTLLPDSCDGDDDAEYALVCNFGGDSVMMAGYQIGDHGIRSSSYDTVFIRDTLIPGECSDGACEVAPQECAILTSFSAELTRDFYEPAFGVGSVPAPTSDPTSDPNYVAPLGLPAGYNYNGKVFQFGENFGSTSATMSDYFDADINNTGDILALFNEFSEPLACVSFGDADNIGVGDVDLNNNDCATIFDGGDSAEGNLPMPKHQSLDTTTSLQAGTFSEDFFYFLFGQSTYETGVEGLCQLQLDSAKSVETTQAGATLISGETVTYRFTITNPTTIPADSLNTNGNLPTIEDDFDDRLKGIVCNWTQNGPVGAINVGDGGVLMVSNGEIGRNETAILECSGTLELDPTAACQSTTLENRATFSYANLEWTFVNDAAPSSQGSSAAISDHDAPSVSCGTAAIIEILEFADITSQPPYAMGEQFTLRATVKNSGQIPLTNPTLVLNLPDVRAPGVSCEAPTPALPSTMAVGEEVTVTYACTSESDLFAPVDISLNASADNINPGVGSCDDDTVQIQTTLRVGLSKQGAIQNGISWFTIAGYILLGLYSGWLLLFKSEK